MVKEVKENRENKDYRRGELFGQQEIGHLNWWRQKKVMFSECNDARNNAEVSPQIFNA